MGSNNYNIKYHLKISLSFLVLISSFFVSSQEINWLTLEEALNAQKDNPKKILMDVYTVWCGPCKLMDKKTFSNTDLINYVNDHYYAVKFNGEGDETINFYGNIFSNPNYDIARKNTRNSTHQFLSLIHI